MVRLTKKKIFIIFGTVILAGGAAAGGVILYNTLVKKHADLGMSKAEVLEKLGDPDHTSEKGETWYYFESGIGKKFKEKDELEHSWNEANQIKAQTIGLEIETKHFESRTIQFDSDNKVVSYLYDTDTKYTSDGESFSSWSNKELKEIKTTLKDDLQCYKVSENKGISRFTLSKFEDKLSYEAAFTDKSLLKVADQRSFSLEGPDKKNISLKCEFTKEIQIETKLNIQAYDSKVEVYYEPKQVTVEGDGLYNIGDQPHLKATPKTGYKVDGWYDHSDSTKSNILSDQNEYNPIIETFGRLSLGVWCSKKLYTITYELDGGTNHPQNPNVFTIDSEFELQNPSRSGYQFDGWYLNNQNINSIQKGTTGDLTITARWLGNLNSLSITSEDTSKGSTALISGSGYSGESITVVATPVGDWAFYGWYHDSILVSNSATYTFKMPTNDYSLVAHFFSPKEEEERAKKYATRPLISDDGKTITYGLYPQTNVNNSSLVSALNGLTTPESNGWYLFQGEYYAKVSAKPFYSSFKFDDGTTIVGGTTYWFKCEPIVWNVLSNNSGEYYIVSSVLLDAHCYYNSRSTRTIDGQTVYANNYKYSDIRAWLNEDFYNSAFALGNSHIQSTTVDNSATTTSVIYSYACANTEDKIFLLSKKDYINSSYGFSNDPSSDDSRKECKTTDWARARGAYYVFNKYKGYYWTRSPYSSNSNYYSDHAYSVDNYGSFGYNHVDTNYSVRPGLSIKIA